MIQAIDVVQERASGGASTVCGAFDAASLLERANALAGIGSWSCQLADNALSWTTAVYDIFGFAPEYRLDRRETASFYAEESRALMERLRAEAIAHARPFTMEARIMRADGSERWMRLTGDVIRDNGRITHLYGLKQDITEEKLRWEALRRLAEHDPITGLANRAVYETRFLAPPMAQPVIAPLGALILFDLDHFKQINDRFGHAAGDACLKAAAQRLAAAFPDAPLVARIGGDEFAVLTDARLAPFTLKRRVARALADLGRPIQWRGHHLAFGASAGMAVAEDPQRYDAGALFAIADEALYAAKAAGRGVMITGSATRPAFRQASCC